MLNSKPFGVLTLGAAVTNLKMLSDANFWQCFKFALMEDKKNHDTTHLTFQRGA